MDVDWIFLYLMRFVVGYTLIFVTSLATKEWLKQNYPCFDQHYNPWTQNLIKCQHVKKSFY